MNPTFTLTRDQLRAMLAFAGRQDIRKHLNGIAVLPTGELCATDGCRLIRWAIPGGFDTGSGDARVLKRETLDSAAKLAGKAVPVTVALGDEGYSVTVGEAVLWGDYYTSGKFPDVDRVVPRKASGPMLPAAATVNPDYLADARTAMLAFGAGKGLAVPFEQSIAAYTAGLAEEATGAEVILRYALARAAECPVEYRAPGAGLVIVVMPVRK